MDEPIKSRRELVERVLSVSPKVDTAMARAFRRACGVRGVPAIAASAAISGFSRAAYAAADSFRNVSECFRNFGSPMDGRTGR